MKTVLHPKTQQHVERYGASPAHAVLLIGPKGSGKATVAMSMAAQVLGVADPSDYPYILQMGDMGGSVGIETVRELEQFLKLKVPGSKAYNRIAIIEGAGRLTTEAQNALLKTLEEPPAGTLLILTAERPQSLLPTIRSRTQQLTVNRPDKQALVEAFEPKFAAADIQKAYAISGGLPGLMTALLEDNDHPLKGATDYARQLLTKPVYERLLLVDELAKSKELAADTVFILQQMAHIALQSANEATAKRWQKVLRASYDAAEALNSNAQTKLVLTNLMLSL